MKSRMRIACAVLALGWFTTPVFAATYYVSTSGNDANSCATATSTTQANQKRHIASGVACLSPGDTLYVHAGTYTASSDIIDNSATTVPAGTDWNAGVITVGVYPSETVTIQPPDGFNGIKLASGSVNGAASEKYIIFQDFIIDGVNQSTQNAQGVYFNAGSNHIRLLRLEVKNWISDGIETSEHNWSAPWSSHFEMINCIAHNNGRGTGSILIHGFYVETTDNLYDGNISYHNSGYGMQLYDNGDPNARPVSNNIVRNNILYDNGVGTMGTAGLIVGFGANNQIYNNVIYGNNGGGILVYANSSNTSVYNNTIYNNGPYAGINVQYIEGDVTIRNNILYSNAQGSIRNDGGFIAGAIIQDHNLTANPLFVNPGAADFHLQSTSAAKDAGVTLAGVPTDIAGALRPQGTGYDIGAYEFHGSAPPSAPTGLRIVS